MRHNDSGGDGEPLVLIHAAVFADWFVPLEREPAVAGLHRLVDHLARMLPDARTTVVPGHNHLRVSLLNADALPACDITALPADARALDLLRLADDAMYRAKSRGGGTELVTVGDGTPPAEP